MTDLDTRTVTAPGVFNKEAGAQSIIAKQATLITTKKNGNKPEYHVLEIDAVSVREGEDGDDADLRSLFGDDDEAPSVDHHDIEIPNKNVEVIKNQYLKLNASNAVSGCSGSGASSIANVSCKDPTEVKARLVNQTVAVGVLTFPGVPKISDQLSTVLAPVPKKPTLPLTSAPEPDIPSPGPKKRRRALPQQNHEVGIGAALESPQESAKTPTRTPARQKPRQLSHTEVQSAVEHLPFMAQLRLNQSMEWIWDFLHVLKEEGIFDRKSNLIPKQSSNRKRLLVLLKRLLSGELSKYAPKWRIFLQFQAEKKRGGSGTPHAIDNALMAGLDTVITRTPQGTYSQPPTSAPNSGLNGLSTPSSNSSRHSPNTNSQSKSLTMKAHETPVHGVSSNSETSSTSAANLATLSQHKLLSNPTLFLQKLQMRGSLAEANEYSGGAPRKFQQYLGELDVLKAEEDSANKMQQDVERDNSKKFGQKADESEKNEEIELFDLIFSREVDEKKEQKLKTAIQTSRMDYRHRLKVGVEIYGRDVFREVLRAYIHDANPQNKVPTSKKRTAEDMDKDDERDTKKTRTS